MRASYIGNSLEILDYRFPYRMLVPVYVRSTGVSSKGLDALRSKGALPWPEPHSADAFDAVFENSFSPIPEKKQDSIGLFLDDEE